MDISLPDDLLVWIKDIVARGGFQSETDYIRQAIESDRARRLREALDAKLREGVDSGPSRTADAAWFIELRERIRQELDASRDAV